MIKTNHIGKVAPGFYELHSHYGFYLDKTPNEVTQELDQQIKSLQNDFNKGQKWNDYLAGEIEHEYKITPKNITSKYIKWLVEQIERESNYILATKQIYEPLNCDDLWVNFQQKLEFNPPHHHNGLYSFVFWHQIPFTIEEEQSRIKYNASSERYKHGAFEFIYPAMEANKMVVKNFTVPTDKSMEGWVSIFPSDMGHMVYPFYTSDDYRITIAGNVRTQRDWEKIQ
jgi:hypothetical protein